MGTETGPMRIYTRRGDAGRTSLIGGGRRYKTDLRIEAYGSVDEAGAAIGLAMSFLWDDARFSDVWSDLEAVQQQLWDVGADLAREHDTIHAYRTPETAAQDLERLIDRHQEQLPPLDRFILRTGAPASAAMHLACTVVRRAERDTVRLARRRTVHPPTLQYLNRLSDLLFVLARVVNLRSQVGETAYRHSAHVFR